MKRVIVFIFIFSMVLIYSTNLRMGVYENSTFTEHIFLINNTEKINVEFNHIPEYIENLRYNIENNQLIISFETRGEIKEDFISGFIMKEDGTGKSFNIYLTKTIKFEIKEIEYKNGGVYLSWDAYPKALYYIVGRDEGNNYLKDISGQIVNTSFKDFNVEYGRTYRYQIKAVLEEGNEFTEVKEITIPKYSPDLIKTYPNPSKDKITFSDLPVGGVLRIYSLNGEVVKEIRIDENVKKWYLKNDFGKIVSSGIYFYSVLDANNKPIKTGKVVVLK